MKLTCEQIQAIAKGVARVEMVGDSVGLFRFTKEQEILYLEKSWPSFHQRTFATAGVSLEFDTDSEKLLLGVEAETACGYRWYVHSIFANDVRVGELSGFVPEGETVRQTEAFSLGEGMKRVRIVFPWNKCSRITRLELDDGSLVIPVPKKRKMLIFGDSITQGYTCWLPENSYANRIARYLDADAINKGIGGAPYWPELAKTYDGFQPDLILVAYGANDWNSCTEEEFLQNSTEFCKNLRQNYPKAKILALSPIWSKTREEKQSQRWPFGNLVAQLKSLPDVVDDLCVIEGTDIVPFDTACFAEDGVHPNDVGFAHYAQNLQEAMTSLL
ncbi:MAG: SGNH/GDSL hydrolase family protein [Ruminococcaceae bacterium]|nr:SGNH/GDSL hydrolase family protein [Oscillospiraceae bacterium]